jgi:alanine racemase
MSIYRKTVAEINLDHLLANYNYAASRVKPKAVIPVIKANAYGHGVIEVMKHLHAHGVTYCAVVTIEEALELRAFFNDIKILVMGAVHKEDLEICTKHNIEITLHDEEIVRFVLAYDQKITVHYKVDSGMSRYGIRNQAQIKSDIELLFNKETIDLKGIYTHLATADSNEEYTYFQIDNFKEVLNTLPQKPRMVHVSNSSSTFKYEKKLDFTTHVRLGISLYGCISDEVKPPLKPVMQLKSEIVQVKTLETGQCLGYGITYCALEKERIAIIPIGYADGFIRANREGDVEIKGQRYPLVGTICMDACFVKIDASIHKGDVVTLFGGVVSLDEVAKRLNTIHYEVLTNISKRVPRLYIKGEKSHD